MDTSVSALRPHAALFLGLPVSVGQVALFCETAADEPFLRRLYRSTREEELAVAGWPETVRQSFCDSQFDLQRAHYRRQHPCGEFLVVRAEAEAVGRLYIDASREIVHLVDIAILPQWRGRGIGSALIGAMQKRATHSGRAMCLHVLIGNRRAMTLYRRFGFAAGASAGSHIAMCWTPKNVQLKTAS